MIQEIWHVSSRCGGGKSREATKELVKHLASRQPVDETYLFASNTLPLSEQNYRFMLDEASQYPQSTIPIKKVDSKGASESVAVQIEQLLNDGFKGVMFTTHKALALMSPQSLSNVRVVIDEVPDVLAGTMMVRYDPSYQNVSWEQYLHVSKTPNGNEIVSPASHAKPQLKSFIRDIRSRYDNTQTPETADLLENILIGHEPTYRMDAVVDGKPCRLYQSVHYHHLKKLVDNVNYLAVLSAQLRETLFGFICEELLGLPIVEKPINGSTQLEKKHKNHPVRIIPFLSRGEWSSALREKPANESLVRGGRPASSTLPVGLYAQEFAERKFSRLDEFMITLNTGQPMLESLKDHGITRTTTKVQGMNHLSNLDHAVYLASTNLTPFDKHIYQKFANDRSLSSKKLLKAIKVERSYETAYQCVARTSIRNNPTALKRHTIIVPDLEYARYIAGRFEPNCASIDTRSSYITKHEYDREVAKQTRLATIINILMQLRDKKGKLKDLIKAAGISRTTYDNYIDEFRLELYFKGLLPSKPSKGTTIGDLYPTISSQFNIRR